jgi:hypothetical protein
LGVVEVEVEGGGVGREGWMMGTERGMEAWGKRRRRSGEWMLMGRRRRIAPGLIDEVGLITADPRAPTLIPTQIQSRHGSLKHSKTS